MLWFLVGDSFCGCHGSVIDYFLVLSSAVRGTTYYIIAVLYGMVGALHCMCVHVCGQ